MNRVIKIWLVAILATVTVIKTFGVPLNETFRIANGGLSPVVTNQTTNTSDFYPPVITLSQDANNTTTKTNKLLDVIQRLCRDDVTPKGATNIDAVNNAAT